jgi:hypothetical protein
MCKICFKSVEQVFFFWGGGEGATTTDLNCVTSLHLDDVLSVWFLNLFLTCQKQTEYISFRNMIFFTYLIK